MALKVFFCVSDNLQQLVFASLSSKDQNTKISHLFALHRSETCRTIMYHTRSSLGMGASRRQPSFAHSSNISITSTSSFQSSDPPIKMIHTIETMPTESFDSMDSPVGPDAHFGDSVFRPSQKENCSRTRAEELGKMLELSDDREMDLNRKKGHFRNETKQAPSLGAGRMNLAQATALYEKGVKEKSQTKKENDILLSEHERKEARTKAYELLVRKTTRGKFYVVPNFC